MTIILALRMQIIFHDVIVIETVKQIVQKLFALTKG